MKKSLLLLGLCGVCFGCGCVDAGEAVNASTLMQSNYKQADKNLAISLKNLGDAIKGAYEALSLSADNIEKIARLSAYEYGATQELAFITGKTADIKSLGNKVDVLGVDTNLKSAEKNLYKQAKELQ